MTFRNDIDLESLKQKLEAERRELLHDTEVSALDRATVELDQTTVGRLTRMDALQTQAMALETERRREVELHRIEHALARLTAGEFGTCLSCGEEIPARRLEMDPATPICVDCAEQAGG